MKKVLIISQAITQTYYDLLSQSLDDCKITLITGSNINAERVIKSPAHNPLSTKSRLICWKQHYTFVLSWAKKNKNERFDLVFATSNPPINSYIGLKVSKLFGCKFVYMNWDLYPQVIEGAFNSQLVKAICGLWRQWNSRNYPKIDKILTLGDGMAESINEQLKSRVPVSVIPLGVNIDYLKPIRKNENVFCINNNIDNKFIVLYSGKMGRGHNIDIILEAATKLESYSDILFLFIGNGEKRPIVENYIKNNKKNNVMLLDMQSDAVFPYSQASGDLCIVSQEKEMAKLFMPSKTYSALACGQGIIGLCSKDDDLGKLISKYGVGRIVSGERSEELVDCIIHYYDNAQELFDLRNRARKVSEDYFSLSRISHMYRDLFEKMIKNKE